MAASYASSSLFPILPGSDLATAAACSLSGIARLAAASPCVDEKRQTEYFLLPVKSILNRCDSERVPFAWTVNPYRGCEFACRYCYARYTHEYMELGAEDFERKIFVKQDAAQLLLRDLQEHERTLAPDSVLIAKESIALGTATDPYQPAEKEHRVTRGMLEQFAEREGLSLSITTKSNLIVRDLDMLTRIAARSALYINITVTTLRPRLARLLEPRAPRPDLRLDAVKKLRDAGLPAGVFAMPILPGLTDGEADLDALFAAARAAGAQWIGAQVLFLMPSAQKVFLPFLEQRFPRMARQYRCWYSRGGYSPESLRREIHTRVQALRKKHGLASRPYAADAVAQSRCRPAQLTLALDAARSAA
jgi:DNA repair photolyase